jgi:hypothetical protein
MNAILDAGAFVAIERRDLRVGEMLRVLQQHHIKLRTSAAVIAQVWRDGARQARLARALAGVEVRALAPDYDKRTGELLAAARMEDVVDAHLALLVEEGDRVLTSDPEDIGILLRARKVDATIVEV